MSYDTWKLQNPYDDGFYIEEVTIEPDEEPTCNYCGKHADENDFWQDGHPIQCNALECKKRRQDEFIAKCQRIVNPDDQYDECPF